MCRSWLVGSSVDGWWVLENQYLLLKMCQSRKYKPRELWSARPRCRRYVIGAYFVYADESAGKRVHIVLYERFIKCNSKSEFVLCVGEHAAGACAAEPVIIARTIYGAHRRMVSRKTFEKKKTHHGAIRTALASDRIVDDGWCYYRIVMSESKLQ